MITGLGTDLADIRRIAEMYQKYGTRFADKILSASELKELSQSSNKPAFLARRFAAKEAFVKALGTGFQGLWFTDITITHDTLGKPVIQMDNTRWLKGKQAHLSISDERHYALAFVVIEQHDR
jgi:holo-[acyl-carrier protein] synthase